VELHGVDLPTIAAVALLSLVAAWLVLTYLDSREEKKRERDMQKAMERLLRRRDSSWDD
jgi:membrane protein implicated in regulation of membrane protease activity